MNANHAQLKQIGKIQTIIYHLYPGILLTISFLGIAPLLEAGHLPPQLGILIGIIISTLPIMFFHLYAVKRLEHRKSIVEVNAYTHKLPTGKLVWYCIALIVLMFIIWEITAPLNAIFVKKYLDWIPAGYDVTRLNGYSKPVLLTLLIVNLILNGLLAPVAEEYYFRGYLLPRMKEWGKWAFVVNSLLFAVYHFWQPQIYLTLLFALLPLCWAVWKTRDLRLGIYTHVALNILGAVASFGLLLR